VWVERACGPRRLSRTAAARGPSEPAPARRRARRTGLCVGAPPAPPGRLPGKRPSRPPLLFQRTVEGEAKHAPQRLPELQVESARRGAYGVALRGRQREPRGERQRDRRRAPPQRAEDGGDARAGAEHERAALHELRAVRARVRVRVCVCLGVRVCVCCAAFALCVAREGCRGAKARPPAARVRPQARGHERRRPPENAGRAAPPLPAPTPPEAAPAGAEVPSPGARPLGPRSPAKARAW
jgi:hypothetical protein